MSHRFVRLIFFCTLLQPTIICFAQDCLSKAETLGNQIQLVTDNRDQTNPAIAVDTSRGNYLLVWTNRVQRNSSNLIEITSRLFGPMGTPKAPPVVLESAVNQSNSPRPGPARVAYDSDNGMYLVLWPELIPDPATGDTTAIEVRKRFVDAQGRIAGDVALVGRLPARTAIHDFQYRPVIFQFVLLYTVNSNPAPGKLFIRYLDASGEFSTPQRLVRNNAQGTIQTGRFNFDTAAQRYLVAWDANTKVNGESRSQIEVQLLDLELKKIGAAKIIAIEPAGDPPIHIAFSEKSKRFAIFWGSTTPNGFILARTINSTGILGSTFQTAIKGSLSDVRFNPKSGGFVFVYRSSSSDRSLLFARLNSDFSVSRAGIAVSCQNGQRIGTSILRYSIFKEEFFVIWTFTDQAPRSIDIFGQRIRMTSALTN